MNQANLKNRLAYEVKSQGVSLDNLANDFLKTLLRQMEALSVVESSKSTKDISTLKAKVTELIDATLILLLHYQSAGLSKLET
jgi:hypothetical protein